jgi:hypothetical protein
MDGMTQQELELRLRLAKAERALLKWALDHLCWHHRLIPKEQNQ